MNPRVQALFVRLEALSLRERVLLVAGTPLLLALVLEGAVLSPARGLADTAQKETVLREKEVQQLREALAARPAVDVLPAADQLRTQRDALQRQVEAADTALSRLDRGTDWASVVRAAGGGGRGLVLTQVRTLAPEKVFDPATALSAPPPPRPGASAPAGAASAAAASAAALADLPAVYRHRAEITMQGDFGAVMAYVQALQQMPAGPLFERLQVGVTAYPQTTATLGLYTLSSRPETPFNP